MNQPNHDQAVVGRESRAGFVLLGIITILVLMWLRIDLVLTDTIPTGGDNGGHLWTADYVRREMLPHLRVIGWSNDWFAGVPVLNFYFPLPTWLIVALGTVLPYNIAYKIITIAGIISLPFSAAFMGRSAGLSRNRSLFLAYSVLPFLLARHFRILGGNIMSTMAGEFSFSLSLSLVVIYVGLLLKLLRTGQGRGRTAIVLACAGLSHIVPTIAALLFTAAALLVQFRRSEFRRQFTDVLVAGSLGGALAAFWIVPFAANLSYTNSMDYERVTKFFKVLFPFFNDSATLHTPADSVGLACAALILTAVALLFALKQRDRFVATWIVSMALTGVAFRLAPQGAMWNIRLLPIWFFCAYLLAGQGLVLFYEAIVDAFARRRDRRAAALAVRHQQQRAAEQPVEQTAEQTPEQTPEQTVDQPLEQPLQQLLEPVDQAVSQPVAVSVTEPVLCVIEQLPSTLSTPPTLKHRLLRRGQGATALASLALYLAVGPAFGAVPTSLSIPNFTGGTFGFTRLDSLSDVKKAPTPFGWAASNEQGMERKSGWKEYQQLVRTLETLPCGRALWELAALPKTKTTPKRDAIRYGSSMSLMSLPYFTNSCTQSMEGLFFESSATAPFHWLTKSMVVEKSSNPQRRLPYPTFDLERGIDRMRALGIRYYLPSTEKALVAAAKSSNLRSVAKSDPYVIYEVVDHAIVTALTEQPVVATGIGNGLETGFIDLGIAQWMDPAKYPTTITLDGPKEWNRRAVTIKRTPGLNGALPKRGVGVTLSPGATKALLSVTISKVNVDQLSMSFSVDKIGVPVLVRISSFPNWVASGAKGPYRATPNFMVVIPTKNNVTLSYARSTSELAGLTISALGITGLGVVILQDRKRKRSAGFLAKNTVTKNTVSTPTVTDKAVANSTVAESTVDSDTNGGASIS
jgi:6-pyruvoyl-tetrahydropterin synthase related domain